jgi:glycosyltransferase involved in cell wall biosynthesis
MLLEVNSPLYEERAANEGIALGWLARWSQRFCWRGADCVLPVTEALARHVERYGVDRTRIVVIPNGIDPDQFRGTSTASRRSGSSASRVASSSGFTGFVRDWHGLDKVIELLAKGRAGNRPRAAPAARRRRSGPGEPRAAGDRRRRRRIASPSPASSRTSASRRTSRRSTSRCSRRRSNTRRH